MKHLLIVQGNEYNSTCKAYTEGEIIDVVYFVYISMVFSCQVTYMVGLPKVCHCQAHIIMINIVCLGLSN